MERTSLCVLCLFDNKTPSAIERLFSAPLVSCYHHFAHIIRYEHEQDRQYAGQQRIKHFLTLSNKPQSRLHQRHPTTSAALASPPESPFLVRFSALPRFFRSGFGSSSHRATAELDCFNHRLSDIPHVDSPAAASHNRIRATTFAPAGRPNRLDRLRIFVGRRNLNSREVIRRFRTNHRHETEFATGNGRSVGAALFSIPPAQRTFLAPHSAIWRKRNGFFVSRCVCGAQCAPRRICDSRFCPQPAAGTPQDSRRPRLGAARYLSIFFRLSCPSCGRMKAWHVGGKARTWNPRWPRTVWKNPPAITRRKHRPS